MLRHCHIVHSRVSLCVPLPSDLKEGHRDCARCVRMLGLVHSMSPSVKEHAQQRCLHTSKYKHTLKNKGTIHYLLSSVYYIFFI